jgi:hypothetical protein
VVPAILSKAYSKTREVDISAQAIVICQYIEIGGRAGEDIEEIVIGGNRRAWLKGDAGLECGFVAAVGNCDSGPRTIHHEADYIIGRKRLAEVEGSSTLE